MSTPENESGFADVAPDADQFPVDSFRDAAKHLRRPFTPAAVKFKVQATWETGALIVAYIDARLAVERLNLIVPHLWHDQYTSIGNSMMWCHLTIDGITRHDVGEGQSKGLVSDALKRAAVKFGVGVSLYAIPKMTLNNDMLKRKQKQGGKDEVTLTEKGEKRVRDLYATWLAEHGEEAFGKALSHGDVEGAQGDPEADPLPAAETAVLPEKPSDVPAEDVWWTGTIEPLLKQVRPTASALREAVEVAQKRPLPEHVGSWEKTICRLGGEERITFQGWLTQQAAADTPIGATP